MLSKFLKLRFDLIFFYIFVFLLPLEKKHVVIPNLLNLPTDLSTQYSAWGAIEIYLTDIVFGLVLAFWLIHLFTLSTEYKQFIHGLSTNTRVLIILGLFALIAAISTVSFGLNKLEIYHLTKLLEYTLLFIYVVLNIDSLVKLLYTIGAFLTSSFLQASLGITQYFLQHSLNLKLFGEVDLSPQIQNVAKIVVDGENYIRAYGTLPHANIFGGYLFVGLLLTIGFIVSGSRILSLCKLKGTNVPRGTLPIDCNTSTLRGHSEGAPIKIGTTEESPYQNCSTWNNLCMHLLKMFHVEQFTLISLPILLVLFTGLIVSFSRSAWLAFIIGCLIFGVFMFRIVPRGTLRKSSFVRPFCLLLLGIITIIVIFFPKILAKTSQFDQFGDKALSGRIEYSQIAIKMVKKSPFFGIGHGNFVNEMQSFVDKPLEWWQFQPVHNVFLLILAETGIFGLLSFLSLIGFIFVCAFRANRRGFARSPSQNSKQFEFCDSRTVPRGTLSGDNDKSIKFLGICFLTILVGLLIIAQFDHYLWDIQQGALLFWLVLGLTWANRRGFVRSPSQNSK